MNQPREVVADALPELPKHVGTQEVYDPNAFGNTSLMRVYTANQMREYAVHYAKSLATQPGASEGVEERARELEGMCDAYHGAREDLLDWKRRAQVAEAELRRLGYTGIVPRQPPAASSDAIRAALEAAVEWAMPMEEAPRSSRPDWFDQARAALRTPAKTVTSHNALRKEEGMITGDELEALIDAAQTTTDSKAVSFLGQVSRELLVQLHGVEAALLAVGKRPPLCDTENAVRYAVGMSWMAESGAVNPPLKTKGGARQAT